MTLPGTIARLSLSRRQGLVAQGAVAVATSMEIVSGQGQSATVSQTLGAPLVVRVLDQNGNPFVGRAVTAAVNSGSGAITPGSRVTDANGLASFTASVGATAGFNSFTVTSAGLTGSPLVFTATGVTASGAFPNAPAGGTLVWQDDFDGTALAPTGAPALAPTTSGHGTAWDYTANWRPTPSGINLGWVSRANSRLRINYAAGYLSSNDPSPKAIIPANAFSFAYPRYYIGMRGFRASNGFQSEQSSVNKLMYFSSSPIGDPPANGQFLNFRSANRIDFVSQFAQNYSYRPGVPSDSQRLGPWPSRTPIDPSDQYITQTPIIADGVTEYMLEWLFGQSTGGIGNGTGQMWVNGVLQWSTTNWRWDDNGRDALFSGINFNPVWGGNGFVPVASDQWFEFDEIRIIGAT